MCDKFVMEEGDEHCREVVRKWQAEQQTRQNSRQGRTADKAEQQTRQNSRQADKKYQ